jgi:arylsulfatase A-like enzyme
MAITRYPEINLMTISRILQKNGYRTCLVHTGGLEYCGQNRFLKNRGFDRIIEYKDLQHNKPYNRQVGWGIDERAMIKSIKDFVSDDRARPFFIIVMPVNPHHPYAIPDKSFECTGAIHEGISYKERNWRQYLHSLHYADHSMGMMIDELEKNGMLNNAITVCYADHGEAFYQHPGNYNHPLYLYEENVHVPFMIYSKKYFSETSFYNGISRHIDIAPTILDIIGLNKPQSFEGISILSAHHEQYAVLHTSWKNNYMGIRDGRWKYIQSMDFGSEELYDLSLDPNEKKNLSRELNEKTRYYRFLTEKSRNYRIKFYNHIINYSAKNPAKKHK